MFGRIKAEFRTENWSIRSGRTASIPRNGAGVSGWGAGHDFIEVTSDAGTVIRVDAAAGGDGLLSSDLLAFAKRFLEAVDIKLTGSHISGDAERQRLDEATAVEMAAQHIELSSHKAGD